MQLISGWDCRQPTRNVEPVRWVVRMIARIGPFPFCTVHKIPGLTGRRHRDVTEALR